MDKRTRGRPREYDRQAALRSAMGVFSVKGFTAASLDDLASATGMNRPSIYNAFGNKESLYREALNHFIAGMREEVGRLVVAEPDLEKALLALYRGALEEYFAERPARGCFAFCTAPVEAIMHPEIRRDMKSLMTELDDILEAKFAAAQAAGNYPADADIRAAARVAQGVLHSLALRARGGEAKEPLLRMAEHAAATLGGG
jgi:AcrR family transcriptional regulator